MMSQPVSAAVVRRSRSTFALNFFAQNSMLLLGVYANLRPVRTYPALINSSPLKNHLVEGTDMIIVRELTGGLYYGTPRGIEGSGPEERGVNTMVLGGRFLMATTTSREPKSGLAVDTMSIYGFDRRNGNFTIVAYDTMGTYYVTAAGKKAPGANEVVMKGEVEEHGGMKKYDMVLRWVDRDTYVTEIIFYLPQGPLKIVDITHRRVK